MKKYNFNKYKNTLKHITVFLFAFTWQIKTTVAEVNYCPQIISNWHEEHYSMIAKNSLGLFLEDIAPLSLSNICPATTVDLTTAISATNIPAGATVTWHTASPATTANKVTTPNAVVAGTYYLAYYDAGTNCYSPVSETVNVTINTCSTINVNNSCPATTVDLTTAISATNIPAGAMVTWHTASPATTANKVTTPNAVVAGTYYLAYYDAGTNCYSSVSQTINVTITTCTCSTTITAPSSDQILCIGTAGTDITIKTSLNTSNSIKFVKFTSDQSITNGSETAGELSNIYAGTVLTTLTPSGASTPYTATYIWNSSDFTIAGMYYIYAILTDDVSGVCRPVQEIKVTVNPLPTFALETTPITCNGANNGIVLIKDVTGTSPYQYSINDGTTFDAPIPATVKTYNNLAPGMHKPAVKDANGCVRKCQ